MISAQESYCTNAIAVCVSILGIVGAEDPWEKVEWGRKLQDYPSVEEFVTFPGESFRKHTTVICTIACMSGQFVAQADILLCTCCLCYCMTEQNVVMQVLATVLWMKPLTSSILPS